MQLWNGRVGKGTHKFLVPLMVFLIIALFQTAMASSLGLKTEPCAEGDPKVDYAKKAFTYLTKEPQQRPFNAFAVSDSGLFAVAFRESYAHRDRVFISVYNASGKFQYGYYTEGITGYFQVFWEGENIFMAIHSCGISLSPTGEVLDVVDIPSSYENNVCRNHIERAQRRKTVEGRLYSARKGIGALGFLTVTCGQVVIESEDGTTEVVYDAHVDLLGEVILKFVFFSGFFTIVILGLRREFRKLREKAEESNPNPPR